MRNTVMLILAIHILLYVSVILDVPILRQCVGFVFLTFLPGFIIFRALNIKTNSLAVKLSLSVSLSIAFVMFIGLLANTLYPLSGISAPLSALPLIVITSALTLAIFILGQTKEIGINSNMYSQPFHAEIDIKGVILCVVSISLFTLNIVGTLYHSVFLMLSGMAGIAAIFASSIFLYKRIPSCYYTLALFVVSLSLLLQTSLTSRHILGYDILGEYSVYKSVRAAEYWIPPGIVLSQDVRTNLNSILSVTILPTAYSALLNLDGELIFKIIYPFVFCFVPIFLLKTYETHSAKIVALLSAFFFIAEPINLYGRESLGLGREMITYLFICAAIFCFVRRDINLKTRRILVITFSAALAVSHYSLGFLFAFFIVFIFVAMRIVGRKDQLIDLALVLCIVGMTFAWYMYVASPPLNKLTDTFQNIATRFTTDIYSTQNRLDPGMAGLSPTKAAASFIGQIHKIVIYISEFFVVVGVIILAIKPKEFKFHPVFRWMAIFAIFLLLVCIAVPNVAPALNFTRFYRYAMVFLAPLFIFGGVYFLGLFRKIVTPSLVRPGFVFRDFRLPMLTIFLVVFFLFRSGFVNTVTGDSPDSVALDFGRLKASISFDLYLAYIPDQDVLSARWLGSRIGNDSLVYADYGLGFWTVLDFTNISRQNIDYIVNTTETKPGSYTYLRSYNVFAGRVITMNGYFNLSDSSPLPSKNDKIYSNGASDIYFAP